MFEPVLPDPWRRLRRFTPARIALGRAGGSQPTRDQLAFTLDHALARDAVHAPFDTETLAAELRNQSLETIALASAAPDRATYLQRPDLGRKLSPESREKLSAFSDQQSASPDSQLSALSSQLSAAPISQLSTLNSQPSPPDIAIIVSDGLSALAAHRQVPPLLAALAPRLRTHGLMLAPICLVRHARVALMDEVGSLLRARLALILLGERPGLGTPDSLGAYFEFEPRPGRTNADRNCLSNIRPAGLDPAVAAEKLTRLLLNALAQKSSGVSLKEGVMTGFLE